MAKPIKQIHNIEIKDYQRSISIYTGEKDANNILMESYEKPTNDKAKATSAFQKTTKATASTSSGTDYQGELDILKNKIFACLGRKRVASFILTIMCSISVGLNLLVIIFFPVWIGTSGGYLLWVIFELLFGVTVATFAGKDCKLKAPKQISKIRRLAYYYIAISSIMLAMIVGILVFHGLPHIMAQISNLGLGENHINMESVFSLMELSFILGCSLRILMMALLILMQFRLHSMCQKYNITEMVDFTKKHMDQV